MSTTSGRGGSFRALLLGSACNAFGFLGGQVAVGFAVFDLTGSSRWVGVSLALYFAPMFLLGLASGAIADWTGDRRRLLWRTELGLAAVLAGFAFHAARAGPALGPMLVLCALTGTGLALHQTLRGAIAFDLAGAARVMAALGRLNLGARAGQLVGAAAAGYAAREAGVEAAFALLACVHLVGAWLFRGLAAPATAGAERVALRAKVREFAAEIRANRTLGLLVAVTAGVEVLGFSFVTALPELARSRFAVGADGLGVLHAARALGGMLAAALFASALPIEARGSVYLAVLVGFAGALLALALAPHLALAIVAIAAIAALAVACDVLSQSMMQLCVADHMRGRAMGAWVFAIGAAPLGHLELGLLSERLGVGRALLLNAGVLLALATAASRGALRRLAPR